MIRTPHEWRAEYIKRQSLFVHDGNLKRPHVILTGGWHSKGYFNSQPIISDEVLLQDAATDLLELFGREGEDISDIKGVVGPQRGATKLAELISNQICAYTRGECFFASPAKSREDLKLRMVFSNKERAFLPGQMMLSCDDVLTSGGSDHRVEEAITKEGGMVLPYILVLVNRSGHSYLNGKKIIALMSETLPMWDVMECPLCKQGSRALENPKENWSLLTADYP